MKHTIKISTPIYTIRNKPMMADFGDEEKTELILREMVSYLPTNPEEVLEKVKDWQKRIKATERRGLKIKDYFLTILGTKVKIKSPRENVWVRLLSVDIGRAKDEVEIEEEQFQFLSKLVENNKIERINREGKMEEVDLFMPFEAGQLILALEGKEEIKKEK